MDKNNAMTAVTGQFSDSSGLSDRDFQKLATFIQDRTGIRMPPSKKSLLTARLQKRLRLLKMTSFSDYVGLVLHPQCSSEELNDFLDLVTTNKTEFFREPAHFDYMTNTAMPELLQSHGAGAKRSLQIWSAPCSTGEEPYTMAMVALEFAKSQQISNFQVDILGTDLSSKVLNKGRQAIYDQSQITDLPLAIKRNYMLKSKDREDPRVRMGPELRSLVKFAKLNFMDANYNIDSTFDIIFCRNCLIYFDRPTSEAIVNKMCRNLLPGGYFFVGHAETLNRLLVPLQQVAPTIYQKQE
jgi:chemotaxis protein methyltransferase CheR